VNTKLGGGGQTLSVPGRTAITSVIEARMPYAGFMEYGFTHYLSGEFVGPFPYFRPALESAKKQLRADLKGII